MGGEEARAACEVVIQIAKERIARLRDLTTGVDVTSLGAGPSEYIRRDYANYLLARRVVTFGTASLSLYTPDLVTPMAALVRGVLETTWVWRWVLADDKIAEKWFKKGEAQIRKEGDSLIEAHRDVGALFDPDFQEFIASVDAEGEWNGLPFDKITRQANSAQTYLIYYPKLSGWAHPNAAGLWNILDPSYEPYGDLVIIAGALAIASQDAVALYEAWVRNRSIPDSPSPLAPR